MQIILYIGLVYYHVENINALLHIHQSYQSLWQEYLCTGLRKNVFNEDSCFKENLVLWKRQMEMDGVFFVWRGKKDDLEVFVWLLNGKENKLQFTFEMKKANYLSSKMILTGISTTITICYWGF